MKTKFNFLTFLLLIFSAFLPAGCGGKNSLQSHLQENSPPEPSPRLRTERTAPSPPAAEVNLLEASLREPSLLRTLDELAELERAGSWIQGMALTESSIRERLGDYTGAVAAAAKEMAWAYGLGLIQKEELEQGLLNVLDAGVDETAAAAAGAVLAFLRGQWHAAAAGLGPLFNHLETEEPDGFGRWMILACALEIETGSENAAAARRTGAAYRSIRARYAQFPEYWHRGARAFSGAIAAEYAENCINSAPSGPFALECRSILAAVSGLRFEDGSSLRTKREVDAIIAQAVNSGSSQPLDALLPLLSLPENPYTVYAVGALRPLTGVQRFREYFSSQAAGANGRLSERLSYISRG